MDEGLRCLCLCLGNSADVPYAVDTLIEVIGYEPDNLDQLLDVATKYYGIDLGDGVPWIDEPLEGCECNKCSWQDTCRIAR